MAISPINIGTGPNTLALVMAEDAYLGDAQGQRMKFGSGLACR